MGETQHEGLTGKLTEAYNLMLERSRETIKNTQSGVRKAIDKAMEKATELGELTREEAELVSIYVMRDLEDAATFINESGRELRDWLRFDIEVVENAILDRFTQMVDQTRLELDQLERRANAIGEWHTGEIVGIGTLQCKSCGEVIHFQQTGHIPPCPKCHGTTFRRLSRNEE